MANRLILPERLWVVDERQRVLLKAYGQRRQPERRHERRLPNKNLPLNENADQNPANMTAIA